MALDKIVAISNEYGSNPDYVLAGGGNTSYKDEEFLYIKGSGTTLATITADGFVKMNRKKLSKLIAAICVFVIGISFVSNYMSEKFTFMLNKNKGQIERIDINSREEMWQSRMDEFSESPIFGVGFAYMKYGWGQGMASTQSGRIESGSGWLSVLSQTGMLGGVCLLVIVMPCIFFLFRNKSDSYVNAWYSGMCMLFILQPITEAYITTIGALLGCLFWLNYSVIESFRIGLLKDEDLDLRSYLYNSSKVNN
jgi:O-antigen ligase